MPTETERPSESLVKRLSDVSRAVVESQRQLIEATLGAVPERPAPLIERLSLDKTLAGKLARGLRTEEPLHALHSLPAPQGLRMVVDAAQSLGVDERLLTAARAACARLDDLQESFPGRRAGLLTVLSGWLPETREREDRHARQAAFRALCTISGSRLESLYNAYVYSPTPDDERSCDTAWIVARQGFRRMRLGAPLLVTSIAADPEGRDVARRRTLDGGSLDGDPTRLLIPEHCSDPLPDLEVHDAGSRVDLLLGPESPALDDSTDLSFGMRTTAHTPRRRTPERSWDVVLQAPSRPTAVMVCDMFVHRSLFAGHAPLVTSQYGLNIPNVEGPFARQVDLLEERVECRPLGTGLSRLSTVDVRDAPGIVKSAFGRLELDPDEYSVHRLRVAYPSTSVAYAFWNELP